MKRNTADQESPTRRRWIPAAVSGAGALALSTAGTATYLYGWPAVAPWVAGAALAAPVVYGFALLGARLARWSGRWSAVRWGALAAAGAFAVWLLWRAPYWELAQHTGLKAQERASLVTQYRGNWATIAGGVLALFGLVAAWRRTTAALRGVAATESGQLTERWTRAIDQLGSKDDNGKPNIEIRLGGIYALEQIARDDPGKYHWPMVEVLTAYLRQNSPAPEEPEDSGAEREADKPLSNDIQAAVRVLKNRDNDHDKGRLDLSRCNLHDADLEGAHLEGAILGGAHLVRAKLAAAHLDGARLSAANLEGAELRGAHLEGAELISACLERADLAGARLERAYLVDAYLREANLLEAHLEDARLRLADLERVYLAGAHLEEADLEDARLGMASLRGANLKGANLRNADLEHASRPEDDIEHWYADKDGRLHRVGRHRDEGNEP